MQIEKIDPIRIKFDGLDAAQNLVELGSLGAALQGASKLIGSGGQVALTGRFSKKDIANSVRVLALPPQPGSYEFWVVVVAFGTPFVTPILPYIDAMVRTAATKATEALVNATIAKWAGRTKETDNANSVAMKALEEMGHNSRFAMQVVERVALANHAAARSIVTPIGISAETVQIGHAESGAFPITIQDKDEIERADPIEIGAEQILIVQISELDLVTKTCKLSLVGPEQGSRRVPGQITDPQIGVPNNPYSSAFDSQKPIQVKCKPQYSDGELDRLYISDTAA